MKKSILTSMKISIAVTTVLLVVFISCGKQTPSTTDTLTAKEASKSKFGAISDLAAPNPFNKRVGAPIAGNIGDQWIANFKNKYGYNKTYTLYNSYLQAILNQNTCVGICLFYSQDNNNKIHILTIGVDINGRVIKSNSVNTMDGNISWTTAQQWISKYSGFPKSHFFGSNTFSRLNINLCQSTLINFALDNKNNPQLLLSNPCVLNAVKQYEDDSNTEIPKP